MKQYTMEGFIEGKFGVRVGTKHCREFQAMCAAYGLRWFSGHGALEFTPDFSMYGARTTIIYKLFNYGFLSYGDAAKEIGVHKRKVIDFEDFHYEKPSPSYQILIDCDGTTTTATMTINGREIKTAIARRNPADKFDWKKGAVLAFDRLWNGKKKAKKRPEVREVKRWAEPGEYIRIVNAENDNEENYCNGDILLVTEYYEGDHDGWVNAKGASVVIDPDEYVVLEGYRP